MRRMTYIVMALAMVLGFTQCKKEQPLEPENDIKTVNITLKVGGNSGAKHDINTTSGAVDFNNGDVIYVGNGSTYIGTLAYNGSVFNGTINQPADKMPIYFYFVGGLTPSETLEAGTTPSFTVNISDQSTKMPVLSCNHVTYYENTTSYSCTLENQCALVKFTLSNGTESDVQVSGLHTVATINFNGTPGITNNDTTGSVTLKSEGSTAKWAVLLPQTSFSNVEAVIGSNHYTISSMPSSIAADAFITGDNAIQINNN